jgi:hypothetical protein
VRQGNKVETPVMVYHYEANGTFDAYKRRLVSVKGDWIGSLMDKNADHVSIEGGLSDEDQARMASMVGDSAAMAQFNEDMAKKAKAQVSGSAKIAQIDALSVAKGRKAWLAKYSGSDGLQHWVSAKRRVLNGIGDDIATLRTRIDRTESSDVALRCTAKIADLQVKLDAVRATVAGLKTNVQGIMIEAGDQDAESAAMVNWTKEVSINQKMLAEAQNACNMRVTQGYSQQIIDNFNAGKALILGGKILSEGDLVIADGQAGLVVADGADLAIMTRPEGGKGLSVSVHGTAGSDERSELLKTLVDSDEDAIAAGRAYSLFSMFSAEVRGALRSAIPSPWISVPSYFSSRSSQWFAAPHFPLLMPPDADGEFCRETVRQQSLLVEFKNEKWNRSFRFKDSRSEGESAWQAIWGAVARWMVAHDKTMSFREAALLDRSGDFSLAREAKASFASALPGIVAKLTTAEGLGAEMLAWANTAYPWISGIDDAQVAENLFGLGDLVKSAQSQIDDGSVRYDRTVPRNDFAFAFVMAAMESAVVAKFAAGAMNEPLRAFLKETGQSLLLRHIKAYQPALLPEFVRVIEDAVGGKIEGALMDMSGTRFEADLRSIAKLGKGAVIKIDYEDVFSAMPAIMGAVQSFAAQRQQEDSGLDIVGYLAALSAIPGVTSAQIAADGYGYAKTGDRYSGSYFYPAGTYLRLSLARGTPVQKKVMDKGNGLDGRCFDKTRLDWLVSLVPAKFSDGKPVADVTSLAKFLNIDLARFTKG